MVTVALHILAPAVGCLSRTAEAFETAEDPRQCVSDKWALQLPFTELEFIAWSDIAVRNLRRIE